MFGGEVVDGEMVSWWRVGWWRNSLVARRPVTEDSAQILRCKQFAPRSIISVKFADDDRTSEGAVDLGGPQREFLRLLLQASNLQSGVFQGPKDRRVLFGNSLGW